jgi:transglutaminase-like putative cysteine protease
MPKRFLLGRLFLIVFVIMILLAAGYVVTRRPAVVYPSIQPVPVEGGTYRDVGMSFRFGGIERSVSIPVNGSVYFGALQARKEAVLTKDIPDSIFIPAYYRSFLDEPDQQEFFRVLTGAFRNLRDTERLDDDRYLELLAVAVQSLPYRTTGITTAPKFPIETYVEGEGDCDDKSLLLAGLLAREGYTVALFYFEPEAHMAVGVKGYQCDYRDTGYGYVAATNLSLVGIPEDQLDGGVNLTSPPLVIPVSNGTKLYGRCQETTAIMKALERTGSRAEALSRDLTSLQERMKDLRSRGKYAEYNQLLVQYNALVGEQNANALAHNYILGHEDDRQGTYAWLKALALV